MKVGVLHSAIESWELLDMVVALMVVGEAWVDPWLMILRTVLQPGSLRG